MFIARAPGRRISAPFGRIIVRLMASIFVGLLAFAPLPSNAFPQPGDAPMGGNPGVTEIAVHCGPHAHYVRGHRDKGGHYVKGRCIRDRRR
jgi:hypothetical protein